MILHYLIQCGNAVDIYVFLINLALSSWHFESEQRKSTAWGNAKLKINVKILYMFSAKYTVCIYILHSQALFLSWHEWLQQHYLKAEQKAYSILQI